MLTDSLFTIHLVRLMAIQKIAVFSRGRKMYISVTGIKPKGITGWLYFLLYNIPASKASKDHDGLLASEFSSRNGYLHTFTVWESKTHMVAYRSSPAHLKAMKNLSKIGSGKIHGYETDTMPSWEDAYNEWGEKAREH